MKTDSEFEADLPSSVRIVALAGRNGSGKSTVLSELRRMLTDQTSKSLFETPFRGTVLSFCCSLLWNDFSAEKLNLLREVLYPYFPDKSFGESILNSAYSLEYDLAPLDLSSNFFEVNFAQSLKRIAAQIFSKPYALFAGETEETRRERETKTLPFLFNGRVLTYRQCLEFLGTEVFRNFAADTWIQSWYHQVRTLIQKKLEHQKDARLIYIGVADLRFENENRFLSQLNSQRFCVYRSPADLVLTEQDQRTHPSRWHFLKFRDSLQPLENISSKEDLGKRLAYRLFDEPLLPQIPLAKVAGWIGVYEGKILFHEFTAAKINQQWRDFLVFNPLATRANFSVILL